MSNFQYFPGNAEGLDEARNHARRMATPDSTVFITASSEVRFDEMYAVGGSLVYPVLVDTVVANHG